LLFERAAKWRVFSSEVLNLKAPSFAAILLRLAQKLDDLAASKTPTDEEQMLRTSLTECARSITAPDGYAILNLDLKTAESIAVAFISGSRSYLEACTGGDLHTQVCRMTWPDKAWSGELKKDKDCLLNSRAIDTSAGGI
jgi:hypothetical protein